MNWCARQTIAALTIYFLVGSCTLWCDPHNTIVKRTITK